MNPSKLYIVATPIGNMEDITFRAVKTLKAVDIIFAEDTRSTSNLLAHYGIQKQLLSFFEGNEVERTQQAINFLLQGKSVALVSESGTPLISDPGYKLIRTLTQIGIPIESIPGPTALVSALTVSGLPTNAFVFLGFLPKKEGAVKKLFETLKEKKLDLLKTVVFYESPHRLGQTLNLIKNTLGEKNVCVARELTKIHEEIIRTNVSRAIEHFMAHKPRGEFVVLVEIK